MFLFMLTEDLDILTTKINYIGPLVLQFNSTRRFDIIGPEHLCLQKGIVFILVTVLIKLIIVFVIWGIRLYDVPVET